MKKNEKGILQVDFITASIIFSIGAAFILGFYYNIFVLMTRLKVREGLIGYITEVCEEIDLEDYDDLDEERINTIIKACDIPEGYTLKLDESNGITKYSKNNLDIVKKYNFVASYEVAGKEEKFSISKVKVREKDETWEGKYIWKKMKKELHFLV